MMKKAMIMPIIFSLLFVVCVSLYSLIFFVIEMPLLIKMVIFLVITGVAVTMVYLLIQRNRELQEEEDDDISKY